MFVGSKQGTTPQNVYVQKCEKCKKTDKKLLKCSQCKSVWYCGTDCQRTDWPQHKKVCQVKTPTTAQPQRTLINDSGIDVNAFLGMYSEVFNGLNVSSGTAQAPQLTAEQLADAQPLVEVASIDGIVENSETRACVKQLGQQLFDKYKAQGGNQSSAGKQAVQDICNWLAFNSADSRPDADKRKAHVEYVWDGIGDASWTWRR